MSTILSIDSASFAYSAVLGRDGAVVAQVTHDDAASRTRQLISVVDEAIGESRNSLDAIAVVVGPGSYAGLRVGIATAQGLALALGIPVIGVPTFAAILEASKLNDGVVIHPAGRGQFAVQPVADGKLVGTFAVHDPGDITATCAGEGAGDLGGTEVSSLGRALAALRIVTEQATAGALETGAEAIYLREPHITVSRRKQTAQIPGG